MNYKVTLSYDGTKYAGWQKQGNTKNTIQGKLEELLSKLTEEDIEIHGAGRTDAGVHARGQVFNFKLKNAWNTGELREKMNRYLPKDIAVLNVETVDDRFHARLSAKKKTYVYRIYTGEVPDVFERRYTYEFDKKLDIKRMKEASVMLCGKHDFQSFNSNKHMKKSTVRTLYDIDISCTDNEIRIAYTGDGFLYNMVRIITGTLIEIGCGDKEVEAINTIIEGKDRQLAGFTAPANGLFLKSVEY